MADRAQPAVPDVRPNVALCAGKDCRRRSDYAKLRDAVDDRCVVIELKCVGICSGPVAVAHPMSDSPLVLAKLRTKQERKQLVRLIEGNAELTDRLARRVVGKSKRKETLRKLRRAVA